MNAIIQARSTSKRLPNKGLVELDGKPLIDHVFQRVSSIINKIVIAVPFDDPLVRWCYDHNVPCFQGEEEDVLARYHKCASTYKMDYIVRITADCPLLDTAQLHYMSYIVESQQIDFMTNLPCQDGSDIEIMSYNFLSFLNLEVRDMSLREHVTLYAKKNWDKLRSQFRFARYRSPYLLEWLVKTSIDDEQDLIRVNNIYQKLKEQSNEKLG